MDQWYSVNDIKLLHFDIILKYGFSLQQTQVKFSVCWHFGFIHTSEKPDSKLKEKAISINISMSTYIIHNKRFTYLYNLFHICSKVILYMCKRTTIKETVWHLCNMNGITKSFCFQYGRMHMFRRQLMNAACCAHFEMYHLCYFIISKSQGFQRKTY